MGELISFPEPLEPDWAALIEQAYTEGEVEIEYNGVTVRITTTDNETAA